MKYTLVIKRRYELTPDVELQDLNTWSEVTEYLTHRLDSNVVKVETYKFTSNGKCLGHVPVTMSNLVRVVNAPSDMVAFGKAKKY